MVLLASVAHGVAAVVLGWNRRSRWGCWRLCWCNSRPQCWCRAAAGRDITVAATGLKLWCCWSWLQLELKEEVVLLVGSRCRWERRSSWTGRDADYGGQLMVQLNKKDTVVLREAGAASMLTVQIHQWRSRWWNGRCCWKTVWDAAVLEVAGARCCWFFLKLRSWRWWSLLQLRKDYSSSNTDGAIALGWTGLLLMMKGLSVTVAVRMKK